MTRLIDQPEESNACASCPAHSATTLRRLGIDMAQWDFVVALAGNPNTGKSTLFNALTGMRQHTGNWPGKTVSRAEGGYSFGPQRFKVIDLPGTYSLLSTSYDEEIARDFILFANPDVTVIVVDATRLERNLNLALQVLSITDRAVICLNLMDEAERHGLQVDERRLARDLGVPVVPAAVRYGRGVPELLQAISDVATGKTVCKPHRVKSESPVIEEAVGKVVALIQRAYPNLPNARWIALRLLEGDQRIAEAIRKNEFTSLATGNAHTFEKSNKPQALLEG